MWTPATRRQHSREGLRYETDLTDAEWDVIAPLLPAGRRRGRPPKWPMRTIWDAIFYVMRGGIAWRLLPKEFPPKSTVYGWLSQWRDSGLFEKINHALLIADRERVGRAASPTAAVLDSQSIKITESGGPSGYDAAKKIKGRKRHVMVDTDGRALIMNIHRASVQDRDSAVPLLKASRRFFPFIARVFADTGYAARRVAAATSIDAEANFRTMSKFGTILVFAVTLPRGSDLKSAIPRVQYLRTAFTRRRSHARSCLTVSQPCVDRYVGWRGDAVTPLP